MATTIKPKLYAPSLGAGAHRLGGVGLPDLSELAPSRTYRTVGDYYSNRPVDDGVFTVGDYYRQQADQAARSVGNVLHGIVELAPPVLLGEMAYIKAKHGAKAQERIFNLPWDPAGKWKIAADRISREESALGNTEIRNLPLPTAARATGTAIVNGATAAGRAVGTAFDAVGDYASAATTAAIEQSRATGRGIMRGFLSMVATTGQGMVDWARSAKPAFQ